MHTYSAKLISVNKYFCVIFQWDFFVLLFFCFCFVFALYQVQHSASVHRIIQEFYDHGTIVCVTFLSFFLLILFVQFLWNRNKNVEDLQMQFEKNAYHFKWKIIKLYWNTNKWKCKKSLNVDVFVHGSIYCHILDEALPLSGRHVNVNVVSLSSFIFYSFASFKFVKHKPIILIFKWISLKTLNCTS